MYSGTFEEQGPYRIFVGMAAMDTSTREDSKNKARQRNISVQTDVVLRE